MRINRLDLIAFGSFTARHLDFSEQRSALQLVYGPNEAGKSTCLRAITAWLFGFSHAVADDHVHNAKQLRIGGEIESHDGRRLQFIRRRGSIANSLRGPDDSTPVSAKLLEELLGGVDQAMFTRQFGLNHETLQSGGKELADGKGELAEILFSAGAGIHNLRRMQNDLQEQVDGLYKPRGQNPKINASLAVFKEFQEAIKKSSLPTEDWRRKQEELDRRLAERTALNRKIAERRAALKRLENQRDAIPLAIRLGQNRKQLADVAAFPLLDDRFSQRRISADTSLENARTNFQKATAKLDAVKRQIAELDRPEPVREHRGAISALIADLGLYRESIRNLSALDRDVQVARDQAAKLLRGLRLDDDLEKASQRRLSVLQLRQLQKLVGDWQKFQQKRIDTEQELARLEDSIRSVTNREIATVDEQSIKVLKIAVTHGHQESGAEQELQKLQNELAECDAELAAQMARLPLFSGTWEELERTKVPLHATIDEFHDRFAKIDAEIEALEKFISDSQKKRKKLERDVQSLVRDRQVPTEAVLKAARERRDRLADDLLQVLRGERELGESIPDDSAGATANLKNVGVDSALLDSIAEADRIVDQMRRDAEFVAKVAALEQQVGDLDHEIAETTRRLADSHARRETLDAAWTAEWSDAGITLRSTAEMRGWLQRRDEIIDLAKGRRRIQLQVDSLQETLAARGRELSDVLAACQVAKGGGEHRLSELLSIAEQFLAEHERALQELNNSRQQRDFLESEANRKRQELQQIKQAFEQWQQDWQSAVEHLPAGSDRSPDNVQVLVEQLQEFDKLLSRVRENEQRLTDVQQLIDKFAQRVGELAKQLNLPVGKQPDEMVFELQKLLEEADERYKRLESLRQQLTNQNQELQDVHNEIQRWENELAELCRQAECQDPHELPQREQASRNRRELESRIAADEAELIKLAAGSQLDEFLQTLESADAEQLDVEIQETEVLCDEDRQALESISQQIGHLQAELQAMDRESNAADEQLKLEGLKETLMRQVDEYLAKSLAIGLLRSGMERFRERHQVPALRRASQIFQELTAGAFQEIRADVNEEGTPHLVAVRQGDGIMMGTTGLSQGTCDQMYLALRIALLEEHCSERSPIPVILDDILIHFDDVRAAAALRVLANLTAKTQVILFTHHRHLVEIARQSLDDDVLTVHELEA